MQTSRNRITRTVTAWMVIFLVLFPKGGIKIGSIPLTWGYGILGLVSLLSLLDRFIYKRWLYVSGQLFALASVVPFIVVFFYRALMFDFGTDGGFVVLCTNFIFLPWFFLWLAPPYLSQIDGLRLIRMLRWCMLAAAIFGIVNFFWRPLAGFFIQVPALTNNLGDTDPSFTKNIARGFFFKLISTYNNGNIYGVATLILINLYDLNTPKRWQRWTLRIALALTLSRTVWAGMIFDLILSFGAKSSTEAKRFPVINVRNLRTPIILLVLTLVAVVGITFATGLSDRGGNFLLDTSLGGRFETSTRLGETPWLPDGSGGFFIAEIVYASAVSQFGYIALPAITLSLWSPLLILLWDGSALMNPTRRAALKGLVLYALLCFLDGAISLIPTMAFYWFTYMVFLFGLPSFGMVVPAERASRIDGGGCALAAG